MKLDRDLWRLEKWIESAESDQSQQVTPPSNIDDLEVIIQNHQKFLLNLDSHKSIVTSLNIVGAHLSDHTEEVKRAKDLRDRLDIANKKWDRICQNSNKWQAALQLALSENTSFHSIVDELFNWLDRTEMTIRVNEPTDSTEDSDVVKARYNKFR